MNNEKAIDTSTQQLKSIEDYSNLLESTVAVPYSLSRLPINIGAIHEELGIDYLRKTQETTFGNDVYYSAHPLKNEKGEFGIAFFLYQKDGTVVDSFYTNKLKNEEDFETIEVNKTTLDDIKKIDHSTVFEDNYDNGGYSYHRFINGRILEILYKSNNGKWWLQNQILFMILSIFQVFYCQLILI